MNETQTSIDLAQLVFVLAGNDGNPVSEDNMPILFTRSAAKLERETRPGSWLVPFDGASHAPHGWVLVDHLDKPIHVGSYLADRRDR